uniref:Speckle-type POZ protein-like protein n=1 Tax=Aegilops tauschii TaxID=37682 RepID=M8C6Y9_AEGTA
MAFSRVTLVYCQFNAISKLWRKTYSRRNKTENIFVERQDVPETWSTSFTEGDTAAHNFEVTGLSLLDGMGAGNFVSSSTFFVGGCEWDITFYPDGWKAGGGAHASAYLRLCNGELGLQTNYTLSLLGKDGQVFVQGSIEHTFQSAGMFWGFEHFVQKSKLRRLLSDNEDCVTIRCVLTVMRKHDTLAIPAPPSNLQEDFARMLKDEEGADVTFIVGDKSFRAHRHVLAARSPAFRAELLDPTKADPTKPVKVDDMDPVIFEALLYFMYTDTLPHGCDLEKSATLQHLFIVGVRYGLDRLATMCEGKLCQNINEHTVATALTLAEWYDRVHLKNACIAFVSSQDVLDAMKETNGFKHLMTRYPGVMVDILKQNLPSSIGRCI